MTEPPRRTGRGPAPDGRNPRRFAWGLLLFLLTLAYLSAALLAEVNR